MRVGTIVLVAATVAAPASGAMLSRNVAVSKQDKSVTVHDLDADKKAWDEELASMHSKLHDVGASSLLEHSDAHSEQKKFAMEYKEMSEKAHKKSQHLSHDEALDMLKGRLDDNQRSQMSLLMKRGKSTASADDENAMFVKSMVALNDMYLSIDEERITTLVTCNVKLNHIWTQVQLHWTNFIKLSTMIGEAFNIRFLNDAKYRETDGAKEKLGEKLEALKSAQAVEMEGIDADLVAKEADVTLYRFIMNKISERCNATKAKLLVQMDPEKEAQCRDTCGTATNSKASMNAVVLEVFSDQSVVEEAKKDLDQHAQMRMNELLKALQKAENEEVHPKYSSFLQVTKPRYMWKDKQAACGCGSLEDVGCDSLGSLIGQELECAKQKVREQQAYKVKVEDEQALDRADINDDMEALDKAMEQFQDMSLNAQSEIKNYRPTAWNEWRKIWTIFKQSRDERFACYFKLFELENNSYCAIKAIRSYMKGLTLEAFKATEEDVQDCQVGDYLKPTGECQYKTKPGLQVDCIEGDVLPSNPDLLPEEKWARDVFEPMKISPAFNGTELAKTALQCPTIYMMQPCNTFLCPTDCVMSEWAEWSTCSAECDGGVHSRSRFMVTPARNGGGKCGATSIAEECNTNPCDVDCVLHEDWTDDGQCLSACQTGDEQRLKLLTRKVAKPKEGRGECPDVHHADRAQVVPCEDKLCKGDEVCADQMDLVIAYECSQSLSRLGCWFMASFVVLLIKRMPAATFGWPALDIALVRFGNGEAIAKGDGTYYVAPAHKLADLVKEPLDNNRLIKKIYMSTFQLWGKSSDFKMGFNNIGQAVLLGSEILDGSDRSENAEVNSSKKILLLTKGMRSGCTEVKRLAEKTKRKGTIVDLVLFSPTYASNPTQFEVLQESVSFPWQAHFHPMGAMSKLNDWTYRMKSTVDLIPKICPDAVSRKDIFQHMCDTRAQLLHRGRTCHDWTFDLCKDGPVSLAACSNLASEAGFKGFIHTKLDEDGGSTECNCVAKIKKKEVDKNGKEKPGQPDIPHPDAAGDQIDKATGLPLESTCTNKQKQNEGEDKSGWLYQAPAAGDGDMTSHYMVISESECPKWYQSTPFVMDAISSKFEPAGWSEGAPKDASQLNLQR